MSSPIAYEPLQWFLFYDAPNLLVPIIELVNISPRHIDVAIIETVQAYLATYPHRIYNHLKIKANYESWLENNRCFFYATQSLNSKTKSYVQLKK